jgi:hypothetical protein
MNQTFGNTNLTHWSEEKPLILGFQFIGIQIEKLMELWFSIWE